MSFSQVWAIGTGVGDSSSNLFRVESHSSSPTAVSVGESGRLLYDIAARPSDGSLFAVFDSQLFSLDQTTGLATLIGEMGVGSQNAMTFSSDGTLYSWGFGDSRLYSVNTSTGAASLVGDTGFRSAGDLAFDLAGNLFGTTINNELVRINRSNGSATMVGALGFTGAFGLFVDASGELFAGQGSDGSGLARLYRVNSSTGAASVVGDVNGAGDFGLYGMDYQAVPEPSSMMLLGLGVAALVRRRKR